ncbi:hypothetical protein CPT_Momento_047 [Burkholderia phage Momento]|uniref:Uncharacterized protein n=1 Tax=Burkholderia phage Momento TaxID=2924902 RepID=A0AAE9GA14_9CAUD|nr:hypothetical protein CPT_Momento_047 [Burkholderia phage Momento]
MHRRNATPTTLSGPQHRAHECTKGVHFCEQVGRGHNCARRLRLPPWRAAEPAGMSREIDQKARPGFASGTEECRRSPFGLFCVSDLNLPSRSFPFQRAWGGSAERSRREISVSRYKPETFSMPPHFFGSVAQSSASCSKRWRHMVRVLLSR